MACLGAIVSSLLVLLAGFAQARSAGDFHQLLEGARIAWAGGSAYLPFAGDGSHTFLTGPAHQPYPPTALLLLWPWTVLPVAAGNALWLLLQAASLAGILLLCWSGLGRPGATEILAVLALCLVTLPVRENFFEGQLGLLLTFLATLAFWLLQRGRQVPGGLALALGICLKLTPILLLPYFALRRGWRLVATAVAASGALAALTLAPGWGTRWPEFLHLNSQLSTGTAFIGNQSINGVVLRLFRPDLNGQPIPSAGVPLVIAIYALDLILLAALLYGLKRLRLPEPHRAWTEFAAVLLLLPLVTPFAWFHHLGATALAIAVSARLASAGLLRRPALTALLAAYVLLTFMSYPAHMAARHISGPDMYQHPVLRVTTSAAFVATLLAALGLLLSGRAAGIREGIPEAGSIG